MTPRAALTCRPLRRLLPSSTVHLGTAALLLVGACGPSPGRGDAQPAVAGGPREPLRATVPCTPTRIVDGDTVHCDGMGSVRIIGMDAPEPAQDPFGGMATAELERLAPVGTELLLERDVEEHDQYGRLLGHLWLQRGDTLTLLSWAMVRGGYAVVLTYPPNVQYVEWLTEAQGNARGERAGLWQVDGFACEPRDYRARRCGR